MNLLDILILVPIVILGFSGLRKGLIHSAASLVGLIAGIYAAIHFSNITKDYLIIYFNLDDQQLNILSFIVTFIIVILIIQIIGFIIQKFIKLISLSFIDKIGGALFGIIKGLLFVSIILFFIHNYDNNEKIISEKLRTESQLYIPVYNLIPSILPLFHIEDWDYYFKKDNHEDIIVT